MDRSKSNNEGKRGNTGPTIAARNTSKNRKIVREWEENNEASHIIEEDTIKVHIFDREKVPKARSMLDISQRNLPNNTGGRGGKAIRGGARGGGQKILEDQRPRYNDEQIHQ